MAANVLGKFFMAFGKDIIEGPLRIIDRQIQIHNTRKDKEHDQMLRQQEAEFFAELDAKKRRENAEIDEMLAEGVLKRQKEIIEEYKRYQQDMAMCAKSIGESLGRMSLDLRKQAIALVDEKREQYKNLQNEAKQQATDDFEDIRSRFPEGSRARETMEEVISDQVKGIIADSRSFLKTIEADFAKLADNIDQIVKETQINTNQYLNASMDRAMTRALNVDNVKQIE